MAELNKNRTKPGHPGDTRDRHHSPEGLFRPPGWSGYGGLTWNLLEAL
ncbi:hypothetical protein [Actinokineospora terrae]|nr:hypothetical protein [Actinokineospora terrae]